FVAVLVPAPSGAIRFAAVSILAGLVALQWMGIRLSSQFQEVTTSLKCVAFLALVVACLVLPARGHVSTGGVASTMTFGGLIEVPAHKTRLAAVALDLAYREGKPVERAQVLHGDAKDFPALLEKLKQSPAFLALQNSSQTLMSGTIKPALTGPQ